MKNKVLAVTAAVMLAAGALFAFTHVSGNSCCGIPDGKCTEQSAAASTEKASCCDASIPCCK